MRPDRSAELLGAYDAQLRTGLPGPLATGETVDRDGPVIRYAGGPGGGYALYRDLAGLDGESLDALIGRQIRFFARRGESFEWKHYGHDRPADLPERLRAAGFQPEAAETVMIGAVTEIAGEPRLPDGVALRDVTTRRDLERIAVLEHTVWGEGGDRLADMLDGELAADPASLTVTVAEADATVVCAAWIRFHAGTEFATLWGGATLTEWRRRGIYRATVAHRANLAQARGLRYLETDASDDSRPILERVGFVPVTTTTPFVWSPPAATHP